MMRGYANAPYFGDDIGSDDRPQKLGGNAFSPANNNKDVEGKFSREEDQCSN